MGSHTHRRPDKATLSRRRFSIAQLQNTSINPEGGSAFAREMLYTDVPVGSVGHLNDFGSRMIGK